MNSSDNEATTATTTAAPTDNNAKDARIANVSQSSYMDVVGAAEVTAAATVLALAQDTAASDSGRESVNEFDSLLDETAQLSKKPCNEEEYYASSGSQTKWYLEPAAVNNNAELSADKNHTILKQIVAEEQPEDEPQKQQETHDMFSRATTTTAAMTVNENGTSVTGMRSAFTTSLIHQMRAVSSPSIIDAILQQETTTTATAAKQEQQAKANSNINNKSLGSDVITVQVKSATAASSPTDATERTLTSSISNSNNTIANNNNNNNNNNSSLNLLSMSSVGVLQKFKRTLTNFNKNQTQEQLIMPNASNAMDVCSSNTTLQAATNDVASSVDATSGKYRFGPLIWRTSKERRKTKYNRRDKCNSGDSGIQIELEQDEQYSRVLSATAGSNNLVSRNIDEEDSPKLMAVRRTSSAKATAICDQTTATALSAKAKILRKMEAYHEREAPESLPTRSLSQPNGLESFGIGRADLDDSDSDSVASHDEVSNYYPIYAEVLYSFTAAGPQELGLERGTLIEVLRKEVGPWWFGRIKKEDASLVEEILDPELGWFPKEFVRVIQCPDADAFFLMQMTQMQQESSRQKAVRQAQPTIDLNAAAAADGTTAIVDANNVTTIVIESPTTASTNSNSISTSLSAEVGNNALVEARNLNVILNNADILRRSAVKELLDTEINYVKLLAAICEGYLPAMSKRIDIFSPNSIRLIFSNIAAIYKFQKRFLEMLRKGIEQNQIAKVFLKMHKGFLCYSTFCNAYPRALIELESYDRIKDAKTILDNCRESENLAELPLSAHLLAPVQRICRYPLHLAEIMKTASKSTEATNIDLQELEQLADVSQLHLLDTRESIEMALEAMKSVTEAVNEGKRHSETIARHQSSFQNFKGPPLHLHSTRFFVQIDATRQKQNLWNSSCTLFLFDNQLIYCKRDIIKRSHFIYKGRIFLDRCRIVNVRDGKMFGHTIKNSLRIYCESRDKWYDFSFRSANRKHRFLNTLALERQFGGKALYVSEMTGFEYTFDERECSDQSDYELPDSEGGNGLPPLRLREYVMTTTDAPTTGTSNTTSGGESSVPDSPAKANHKFTSETLPKKSQKQDSNSSNDSNNTTGSLGRRRLGNWFRKPKSTNSTPNHSPTHKPAALLTEALSQSTTVLLPQEHECVRVTVDASAGSSC